MFFQFAVNTMTSPRQPIITCGSFCCPAVTSDHLFVFATLCYYGMLPMLPSTNKTRAVHPLQTLGGSVPNLHCFVANFQKLKTETTETEPGYGESVTWAQISHTSTNTHRHNKARI